MHTPAIDPNAPAGFDTKPENPFGAAPEPQPATPPVPAELRLNRATRRAMLAANREDIRLLSRVAAYDVNVRHKGQDGKATYPTELAATYGLEHAAKAMRAAKALSNAELHRVKVLARGRRHALKETVHELSAATLDEQEQAEVRP